ncbi:hypothetical protein llap_20049 [Limosa lapponica baueri]|uniref:Uncharacterized protein n=1 Tax=Limosa lapponica baueri TaxID=1758121 RepID=A0A2I0T7A2_LIMLA|nr:hypothetical protein llap_20049 [Limosa lapponica baueri]
MYAKSVKKEREEVLQALKQMPLQPVEETMVMQIVPPQPMEDHGGEDIHTAARGEPMPGQAPGRNCVLWKAGFLAGPMLEQSTPEGLYPMERTHAGAVLEEPTLEKFMKNCLL